MSEEVLVNITPMETRIAVVDAGILEEIHIERRASSGIVGNIYTGKVVRVMSGMQAAFVDIGTGRNCFIHVDDLVPPIPNNSKVPIRRSSAIGDYLHEGKKIVVQVTKDPMGSKGARLTTALSIPSRYLVFMPHTVHLGVSHRIDDSGERERLLQVLSEALAKESLDQSGGFILRTAAEGVGLEEILADLRFLGRLWATVSQRARAAARVGIIHQDFPLQLRVLRDFVHPGVDRIRVDNKQSLVAMQEFCADYAPQVEHILEHYLGHQPLFHLYDVDQEIQRALNSKVELKSGGYLVIEQTEAMTTVDVNTGSFLGRSNLEETAFQTNLEAAVSLAHQLRLRNLGGIIIIDFIDMQDHQHRTQLHLVLEKAMSRDSARNSISPVSDLGLVQMTRMRVRESLAHILCEDCPTCQGRGVLKSAETVCHEIFRAIMSNSGSDNNDTIVVLAAARVVDRLMDEESANVARLQEFIGKSVSLKVEPMYSGEQFDIVPL
ncbi:MAG: ribonuclease G [Halieaceae bacterium]|jgi:ribonuclease G|nr:ribonuclease G [Halieaceae bacterium]